MGAHETVSLVGVKVMKLSNYIFSEESSCFVKLSNRCPLILSNRLFFVSLIQPKYSLLIVI
jgi:hypothetical protein